MFNLGRPRHQSSKNDRMLLQAAMPFVCKPANDGGVVSCRHFAFDFDDIDNE